MARAITLNSKAGYTCAVVPQSSSGEMLAKREGSIYGFAHPVLCSLAAAIDQNQNSGPALEMPPNLIPDYFGQSLSNPVIEEFRL